jgi:DNA polymerase-4
VARRLKDEIRRQTRLTGSIGVAPNKFLAKLASDLDKPDGLTVVPPDGIEGFLGPMPIGRLWGVGPATARKLRDLGVQTFGDLRRVPARELERRIGAAAGHFLRLARGIDDRPVVPDHQARSIGQEQTFGQDVADPAEVRQVLLSQCEQVGYRVRRHGLRCRTVTVKIRYGQFETITRSQSLVEPTDATDGIWHAARALFDTWAGVGFRPVRLIGVTAGRLTRGGEQLVLFAGSDTDRRRRVDRAMDGIRDRFGKQAIHRGGVDDTGTSEPGRLG